MRSDNKANFSNKDITPFCPAAGAGPDTSAFSPEDALKLDVQLCFPLYAASREVIKNYRPLLEELDLTYTQYIAMMVMWEEKAISVKDMGQKLFLDSGTLTPVLKALEKKPNCERVDIVQTYLKTEDDEEEVRIRQRGADGHYIYFRTRKRKLGGPTRVEEEERLSQEEYLSLMMLADPACRPIRKERYCLSENGLYYEIDIYPDWKDRAIMEIELHSEDQEIVFPEGIDVIREVTGEEEYSNHALARINNRDRRRQRRNEAWIGRSNGKPGGWTRSAWCTKKRKTMRISRRLLSVWRNRPWRRSGSARSPLPAPERKRSWP